MFRLSSFVVSHFCTKYEYILYWKLSSSDTKFLNKDLRKTEDDRLTSRGQGQCVTREFKYNT